MDNSVQQTLTESVPKRPPSVPGDASQPPESVPKNTPPPLGGGWGGRFGKGPPGTPTKTESVPTGRCAWCGTTSTRTCCPQHPYDLMCDTCRAVPRRPDHHRNPFEADPGTLGTICNVCRTTVPFTPSWPWTGGTRICVPCLWDNGHKDEF